MTETIGSFSHFGYQLLYGTGYTVLSLYKGRADVCVFYTRKFRYSITVHHVLNNPAYVLASDFPIEFFRASYVTDMNN